MKLIKHDTFFNDPWTDLDRLIERTLPELYQWTPLHFAHAGTSIPLDVYESDDMRVIRLEIPGVNKKDIEIKLENAVLSITAKRTDKLEDEESTLELKRSVSVGDDVDPETVRAQLNNGILEIQLPKREHAKPRQISIS